MKPPIVWNISQTMGLITLVLLGLALWLGPATAPTQAQQISPLMFIENVGQVPTSASGEAIRFQVHGDQATLSLTDDGLRFTLLEKPNIEVQAQGVPVPDPTPHSSLPTPQRGVNLKLSFADANSQPSLEPFNRLETHVSFFVGNDPANWHPNVPVWSGVRYVDLYPGLDLEVTSEYGQLVQRLVMKEDVAMADTSPLTNLRWQVEGADALSLENGNQLRLATVIGDFTVPLPQLVTADGAPLDLSTTPEVNGLEIASPFSPAPPLPNLSTQATIAPPPDLLYSTFLGGSGGDHSAAIAVDGTGHAYITGSTYSADLPTTPGVFDPSYNWFDAYVAKLNPNGDGLVYATFLGGHNNTDYGNAISVDETGSVYVAGFTAASDFPTTPAASDTHFDGAYDAFAAKLNPAGSELTYATFIGGTDNDFGEDLAVDEAGQAYVTGSTHSGDFPVTTGAWDTTFGGSRDAFVVKLNPDGSQLGYATYLGGDGFDSGTAIAVDGTGRAYATGNTWSADFPTTPGAFDTTLNGLSDAFVVKLNSDGRSLAYATFLGGTTHEPSADIAVDGAGQAYVLGDAWTADFPTTPGAFDTTLNGPNDIFVVKLDPAGSGLVYSTFMGGMSNESGYGLVVDGAGRAYLTGYTVSSDFPVTNGNYTYSSPNCSPPLNTEAFVAKLSSSGANLSYGAFLGGGCFDYGHGVAVDAANHIYVTGYSGSSDFPLTAGAFDTSMDGGYDAFITKLATGNEPEPPTPTHTCAPTPLGTITVSGEPRGLAVDPTHQRLYVANFASNSVSVIDTNTNTVIQTIGGINSPNGIAYDSTHNEIWVTNYHTDQVTPIQANDDATSFTVLPAVTVGDGPWGVAYDPTHRYLYVTNSLDNSVTVVHTHLPIPVGIATLTGSFNQPFHVAANPVTGKVYVSNFGGHSVTVLSGTTISRVVDLYDSSQPYGLAVDETRDLVYVATVGPHRVVAIGPIRGVPDQFLGWAAFHRGFGNPRRPVPLRMIALNPSLGPAGDGGHLWATTATMDGSETNQALFIPKGWGGYFHFPLAQNVGDRPTEGLAIDRVTNRVYVASGISPGVITVIGDHSNLCADAFTKIASLEDSSNQLPAEDTDQIGVEIWENKEEVTQLHGDVNGDSVINVLDLAFVASRYGSGDPVADLNADGRVDIMDLAIIAENYRP